MCGVGNLTRAAYANQRMTLCRKVRQTKREAEYGDRATCVTHTWRVSSCMFLKGVWRCLLQDVDDTRHATSFFQIRGVPHPDVKARHFFSAPSGGPKLMEARERKENGRCQREE